MIVKAFQFADVIYVGTETLAMPERELQEEVPQFVEEKNNM